MELPCAVEAPEIGTPVGQHLPGLLGGGEGEHVGTGLLLVEGQACGVLPFAAVGRGGLPVQESIKVLGACGQGGGEGKCQCGQKFSHVDGFVWCSLGHARGRFPLYPFPAGFQVLCHRSPQVWRVLVLRGCKCHGSVMLPGADWCRMESWVNGRRTIAKVRTFHLIANLFPRFLSHWPSRPAPCTGRAGGVAVRGRRGWGGMCGGLTRVQRGCAGSGGVRRADRSAQEGMVIACGCVGTRMRPRWHTHAGALAHACGCVHRPAWGWTVGGWGHKRKMSGLPAAHLASCPRVLSVTVALPSVMVASCGCACRVWLLRLQAAVFPVPGQSCKH